MTDQCFIWVFLLNPKNPQYKNIKVIYNYVKKNILNKMNSFNQILL